MNQAVEDATRSSENPESTLRGFRVCLEFDGTGFEGWQRQAEGRTVQAEVEQALLRILGTRHAVIGCGRTDAGTHARGMVASFRTQHAIEGPKLERALDAVLPDDIGLRSLVEVSPSFHARRDALWKWYRYRILVAPRTHPLAGRHSWRRHRVPSLDLLNAATAVWVGRHDFASFANAGSEVASTVRTLHALRWHERDLDWGDGVPLPRSEGHFLVLDAVGDGFLYKMVRTLVGSCLAIAGSASSSASAEAAIDTASPLETTTRRAAQLLAVCDRTEAGAAVPACGLTLMAVAVRDTPLPELPSGLLSRDRLPTDAGVLSHEAGDASGHDSGIPPTDGSPK